MCCCLWHQIFVPFCYSHAAGQPTRYTRGVTSPLVRQLGSGYAVTAPLRAALYHHLGMDPSRPVIESYPVWDNVEDEARFVEAVSL